MLNYEDLDTCDTSVFRKDAARWQGLAGALANHGNDLQSAVTGLDSWIGDAADAAKAEFGGQRQQFANMAETVGKIPPVLTNLAGRIDQLREQLEKIVIAAQSIGCQVHPDGTVTYDPTIGQHAPIAPGQQDMGPDAAIVCQDDIADVLNQARAVDAQAKAALQGLTAQAAGFAPAPGDSTMTASATAIPAPGTSPADVRKWWDSLSPLQQESLLFTHGAQLGQLDGLPSTIRDRANRAVMAQQKGDLQAEQEQLTALGSTLTDAQQAKLNSINEQLGAIGALEQRLYHATPGEQPAFLLGFSTSGNGRAIVAMGNPDTATNVATFVPGTGARLGTVNEYMGWSDNMVQAANTAGSPSTSVIAWVGYNAPQDIFPQAAENSYADGAKQDLDRFEDGLRASHDGPPAHNTVIGHSYGTTVVGHAARDGDLNANDVVFVASPGVGVTNADQLHLDGVPADQVGQHIHSTVAQHDPIQLAAGVNGPSPTGLSFGGTTFNSKPGDAGPWYELGWNAAVHSQYWNPGNTSLTNMGLIIAGKPANA